MKEEEDRFKIPTLVRLEIWLGLAKYQQQWFNRKSGKFNVFAERVCGNCYLTFFMSTYLKK